jgi:hypothetical protein
MESAGMVYQNTWRSLRFLAATHDCAVRNYHCEPGRSTILFHYIGRESGYERYWSIGNFSSIQQAVAFSRAVFLTQGVREAMTNVYKDPRLFPHIKGAMVREKRTTLVLDGSYKVVEIGKDGGMAEIGFVDHDKKVLLNGNQILRIAEVYGPESTNWKDKPVVFYAERGDWFGRLQWGMRVDVEETLKASKAASKPKASAQPAPGPKRQR